MVPLNRFIRRVHRDESGAEIVEAALTFPLLLFVVLGILDFGLLFQQYEVITNAAREGARVGVLPDYTAADAKQRAWDYIDASFLARGLGSADPTVEDPVYSEVAIGGKCMETVTVTVTYPHEYLFIGGVAKYFDSTSDLGTRTLIASSTMRREKEGATCTP